MLKYQLRKDVALEDGMAFKYKSKEELEALISALNKKFVISIEKINSSILKGFLIVLDTKKMHCIPLLNSKFFTRSDQYLVRKKDVFNKTEYDNGPKNNKGSVGQYYNASNLRDQTDINNNGGPVKDEISVHDCGFRTSKSQTCSTTAETNKPFVAYALTDGFGLMVPLQTCKEGTLKHNVADTKDFFDMLYMVKTTVSGGGAEQDPFADKLHTVGMETDRIKKLVASKFPLFIRTGIHNVASETPSVYFRIPGTFFNFKITLKGEKVIDIEFYFGYTNVNNIYDNALKELIAQYFNLEKEKPKEGIKFESVTDKNGDTRILMTDSLGNKSTLI